ncbi:hypothetical protein KEM48_014299 [Puccinia striiformis f. sp. tritici PST-130]|uniref:Uncharacterized protein n=2 Tax=Puccinia striiformis TaxID=27350 RepID=A0A0L0UQI5_9BASI|nr:hypothetical protein KEM48_014299 [Puccinia striiformis f. sp. tritici PST-130]KNE89014.1 hypothetical protein PSTG_17530 [Puccinia striiformis f. sp. tritici PST-78]POW08064.1 hypothetical protein PSTT_07823 [Puccinia striiformis]
MPISRWACLVEAADRTHRNSDVNLEQVLDALLLDPLEPLATVALELECFVEVALKQHCINPPPVNMNLENCSSDNLERFEQSHPVRDLPKNRWGRITTSN